MTIPKAPRGLYSILSHTIQEAKDANYKTFLLYGRTLKMMIKLPRIEKLEILFRVRISCVWLWSLSDFREHSRYSEMTGARSGRVTNATCVPYLPATLTRMSTCSLICQASSPHLKDKTCLSARQRIFRL